MSLLHVLGAILCILGGFRLGQIWERDIVRHYREGKACFYRVHETISREENKGTESGGTK